MGKIIIVSTPLGNLGDITFRAIEILKEVDLILAEDTRKSAVLLRHYGIGTRMSSYHQHNEHDCTERLLDGMGAGDVFAMITDAGTPGISDPGFLLVREAIKRGIEVECLPGPVAFIPALVCSGLPCDRFHFEGFLPHKKGRASRMEWLKEYPYTIIFYESPFRLWKTIQQLRSSFGDDRRVVIARELTKIYEEYRRGSLLEMEEYCNGREVKGEIVLMVEGKG